MTVEGLEKVERAALVLQKAIKIKPNDVQLLGKYAKILKVLNRCEEAAEIYSRLNLINKSQNYDALYSQAQCLRFAGRVEEAATIYRQYLQVRPKDERAQFWLAVVQGDDGETCMPRCPKVVVSQLFDAYADTFDQHLVKRLKYHTPQIMQSTLLRYMNHRQVERWRVCVDLGCGTGLMGPLLRPVVDRLTGIDLSQGMISKALQKGCYDFLFVDDAVNFLQQCHGQVQQLQTSGTQQNLVTIEINDTSGKTNSNLFDLIVAADVVVYIGQLKAIFESARSVSYPGTVFLFSTELLAPAYNDTCYVLQQSGRYAHSEDYIRQCAENYGWNIVSIENCIIRNNCDEPVQGQVVLLEAELQNKQ